MTHRMGLSIGNEDLRHVGRLQRRMGIKSRSRFFCEIVRRYEKLENSWRALSECRAGYLRSPEKNSSSTRAVLKGNLKTLPSESWE